MMKFESLTPNLVVADIDRSLAFYRDVLGFALLRTVPDDPPLAFAWMTRDGVNIFLNSLEAVRAESPALVERPLGGTLTLYLVLDGIEALYARAQAAASLMMPLKTQPYGMREFAIADPDGYVLTFAERVGADA
jgi:uncharacterized glyoxalase superfamily protein PhnB